MRYIYSLILYLLIPLILLYLKKRGKKNPNYNDSWHERFGIGLIRQTDKPIIWIHAVSIGEIRAASKLIELLENKFISHRILITQMTPTGRETAKRLYGRAIIHYIPYDLPHAVINFYKIFKPKIGLIMETEIWPNLIYYAHAYKIPLFLVNARLSKKSFDAYNRIRFLIKPILNKFNGILCQDTTTEENFIRLGFNGLIQVTGSTKFDLKIDFAQIDLADKLKKNLGSRKVVIFASTRDGEEELIISKIKMQNYLIIIVPRHLERFQLVEQLLLDNKIKYIKRSSQQIINNEIQVFLGDSMGEMFMYYAMSDITVMGGSINNFGGQNLIEPIFLNKPVILGPSIFNFEKIAQNAINDGCAIQVKNVEQCFIEIDKLVSNEAKYNLMQSSCKLFYERFQGASQKTADLVGQYI